MGLSPTVDREFLEELRRDANANRSAEIVRAATEFRPARSWESCLTQAIGEKRVGGVRVVPPEMEEFFFWEVIRLINAERSAAAKERKATQEQEKRQGKFKLKRFKRSA